jgi:hypothetical protein
MRGQRHAPAAFYHRERPGTHCTGGWVGPRVSLGRCGKSSGFDPRTVHPVVSRYPAGSATSSSKPCTKLTLHCNHRSGHLETEHTESLFLLLRHLGNWSCGPAVSMRIELLVAHEKLTQLPLLTAYILPV